MTNRFIADVLFEALSSPAQEVVAALPTQLQIIPTGNQAADDYHRLIDLALRCIFPEQLTDPSIEQGEAGERKFVDIVYRNAATEGFFAELKHRPEIRSEFVIVECKNYEADVKNPEFDQLRGRLNKDVGNFGILACRRITDRPKMLQRIADAKRDDKYIVCLTDTDVTELAGFASGLDYDSIDRYMLTLLREMLFF